MDFINTALEGVVLIKPKLLVDERGFFARSFCKERFADFGLSTEFVQSNRSKCRVRGTIRGLHYQNPPHLEAKLVHCVQGRIFDVAVDLREGSPSFLRWFGVELSAEDWGAIYVGPGFAHGYMALTDEAEVFYQSSAFYEPSSEGRIRFNDPKIGIRWPSISPVLSPKDRTSALLDDEFRGVKMS